MIKNKVKQVLSLMLALTMVATVSGCGKIAQSDANNNSSGESDAIVIDIDNTMPVNSGFEGLGGVYHYSSFGGDAASADPYSDEQIAFEIDNLKKTGIKYVRTYFNEEMPYVAATKSLDWDSEAMEPFYNYLDAMQEAKIDVAVCFGWWISELGGLDLVRKNIAVFREMSGSADYDACLPYYAKFYSEFVQNVVVEKGYTCVKYGLLFTEPNNNGMKGAEAQSKELFDKWLSAAKALDTQLKKDGVRDKILLVGPNSTINAHEWLEYAVKEANDIIDIYSCHKYVHLTDWYDESGYYSQKEWAQQAMEIVKTTGKPFWCDETNVYIPEYGLGTKEAADVEYTATSSNHPLQGTQLALNAVTCLNQGMNGFLVWSLASQKYVNNTTTNGDSFIDGVQHQGLLPYLYASNTPRYAWYAYSMICSALNHPEQAVYSVSPKKKIYSVMTESSDGTKTIVAINTTLGDSEVSFKIKKHLNSETVYRYVYNPATVKPTNKVQPAVVCGIYEDVTDCIEDTIPSNAVVVYTTAKY